MHSRLRHLLLACALAIPTTARADPATRGPLAATVIRAGDYDGYGRVVFALPPGASAEAATGRDGSVVVQVSGASIARTPPPPRNVQTIAVAGSEARVTVAPRATWSAWHRAGQLVIDVFDAPAAGAAPPWPVRAAVSPQFPPARATLPALEQLPPGTPVMAPGVAPPLDAPRPAQAPALPAATAVVPSPTPPPPAPVRPVPPVAVALAAVTPPQIAAKAPATPVMPLPEADAAAAPVTDVERVPLSPSIPAAPVPAALAPMAPQTGPLALAASAANGALSLPFAPGTAAAAFRRGPETVVVFDERRPLDLAALRDDPVFGTARVQLLPAATTLRMTLPPATTLGLAPGPAGWVLTVLAADRAPSPQPLGSEVVDGRVRLPAASPGGVVSVPDPDTGGALLVGTQRDPGQGIVLARRTPAFMLLATLQGVVVESVSDALSLHATTAAVGRGFVIEVEGGRGLSLDPLDAGALAATAAAHLTRRWDFPNLPVEALLRRLQSATEAAAAAPPQARAGRRLAAVQAQLALGFGAEAHALATLAATEDARAAATPDAAALDAVAALLAGRLAEADAIEDSRVLGTDEVALWRAARQAMRNQDGHDEPAPEAAAVFAATLPLVLAYPQGLRARLLPLAAETMAQGGERAAARRLLDARKADASLDYARALLDEAEDHAAPALEMLDRLARSPDRKLRVRAGVRAAELRLRTDGLTTAQAADALDRLIYAWRGDGRELALRLRVAALRVTSGNWRAALALLRETNGDLSQAWPDQRAAIRAQMTETFAEAMAQDGRAAQPPLELVSLLEENPDLLPEGEPGRALAARLADRLAALDLPARAMPVLEKLVAATPAGAARAELGGRLAALRLGGGDTHGALLALSASTAADLLPALTERRTIIFARATAAAGALPAAVASLEALDGPAADETRADLLETAKDWPGAAIALSSLAARTVPVAGPLDDAPARLLLRLASAAAQAGDEPLLARLRHHDSARMPPGKLADMFALLTASPVQGVADLPRAAREAVVARALSDAPGATVGPVATR